MISIPTNLEEFDLMYPTTEACRRALWEAAGEVCSYCGGTQLAELKGRTSRQCKGCRKHISVTAGTAFHGCHHLRASFLLAFCIFHGLCISASELANRTQIAGSTALSLVHKLQYMLLGELAETACTFVDADAFAAVLFRRSKVSPAGQHPSAPSEIENSTATIDGPPATESITDQFAELAITIISDSDSGLGSRQSVVETAIATIKTTYHGISRKYVQLYLALYWSSLQNWSFESLIRRCLASSVVRQREIEAYVSPKMISMSSSAAIKVLA